MPVRQIGIPEFDKIMEMAAEMLPETAMNMSNLIADKAHELWILKAMNAPKRRDGSPSGWGERYARAIKLKPATGKTEGSAKVYVDENSEDYKYVEMIEEGFKEWSISDALLAGKAAARNRALYGTTFVRVPFRYRTPGVTQPTSGFVDVLPRNIYQKAKKGERIGPEAGLLAGLVRVGGKQHGQYFTFRTVTKDSNWMHPGFTAVPVFEEVKAKVEKMIAGAVENLIKGFLGDVKKETK